MNSLYDPTRQVPSTHSSFLVSFVPPLLSFLPPFLSFPPPSSSQTHSGRSFKEYTRAWHQQPLRSNTATSLYTYSFFLIFFLSPFLPFSPLPLSQARSGSRSFKEFRFCNARLSAFPSLLPSSSLSFFSPHLSHVPSEYTKVNWLCINSFGSQHRD